MKREVLEPQQGVRRSWIARAPFSPEIRHALDAVFENVFCSAVRFEDATSDGAACAWVEAVDEDIRLAILFAKQGVTVNVLNEIFPLSSEDLAGFARAVFDRYRDVDLICLPSVATGAGALPYPCQRYNATEDIVAPLPDTVDRYWSMLSKNTRDSIRRYRKRIAQQFPDMQFEFYERTAVTDAQLLSIVDLNRARIEGKRETPSHTAHSLGQLKQMVGRYGVTLVATLHGKPCAGVICTRVGNSFFMHVIAHDPALDALRLGKVCCYLSICDAIERGGKEYHMLSGQYDYKFRFMGQQRDFDRITMYRSPRAVLRHWPRYVLGALRGEGRALKKIMKTWRRRWTTSQTASPG